MQYHLLVMVLTEYSVATLCLCHVMLVASIFTFHKFSNTSNHCAACSCSPHNVLH